MRIRPSALHPRTSWTQPSGFRRFGSKQKSTRSRFQTPPTPTSTTSSVTFRREVRPAIFLRDNVRNLRALWKNDDQEQIGLQFLGGGDVQFVILKRRSDRKLTTLSGIASGGELLALVRAVGATALFE